MRLIDADELKSMYSINRANFNTVVGIQKWVDNAPTVQAIPIEVLQEIRQEIADFEEEVFHEPNTDYKAYASVRYCCDIIDKHIKEIEE